MLLFSTANTILQAASADVEAAAIENDQDEEREAFEAGADIEDQLKANQYYLQPISKKKIKKDPQLMSKSLKSASADVIVTGTQNEYRRHWNSFLDFCIANIDDSISSRGDIEALLPILPAEFPNWVAYWIMDRCDSQSPFTGEAKHPSEVRSTYGTAQKMRAAISHQFGREYTRGTQPWVENPHKPGQYIGNPSLATTLSQYMISLRRRKVRAGEVVTSARAVDEETMKKLYDYNINFPQDEPRVAISRKRKQDEPECWAGYGLRLMLMLMYSVSMLCLLRYDETLKITWDNVTFGKDFTTGNHFVRLDLPFRKTHQNGGIAPFYLYAQPDRPWLCTVTLFAKWWKLSGSPKGGYVFRRKHGNRFSDDPSLRMTSESFLECFRTNLCDIGIDPRPYGTHSFRRGGCQFLALVLRWPYRTICDWGGWAENFDNPGTIFKYLLSWTDNPMLDRKDYLNPNKPQSDPCTACGRTCHCA